MTRHVFVSYSRTDAGYVNTLVEFLRDAGLPVWVDDKIDYGERWETVIREKVETCAVLVPVMSPEALGSRWVEREINHAEGLGKPIVPLLLAGTVWFRLNNIQYEDVRDGRTPTPQFVARLRDRLALPAGPVASEVVVDDRLQRTRMLIARGVDAVAGPVRRTMGPKGRGSRIRCADGVFRDLATTHDIVANYTTDLADAHHGITLVRELVQRVETEAGDGATTAVVLAHALLTRVVGEIQRGADPEAVEVGVEVAAEHVLAEIERGTREVATKEEIAAVVRSALGERTIGDLVAEAMDKVGKEGVIVVEKNLAVGFELELCEGMRFDRGFISSEFVTDESRREVVLEDPVILLLHGSLTREGYMPSFAREVMRTRRPLLVVADSVDGETLAALVEHAVQGRLRLAAVGAPGYGPRREQILRDLAIQTGGFVVPNEKELPKVDVGRMGRARKVVVTKDETTIVGAVGDPMRIRERVNEIRAAIEESREDYEREKLQERLAKLAGGVAVIRFGGHTSAETASGVAQCERGVRVAKAAVYDGILPGGGAAILGAGELLNAQELVRPQHVAGAQALLDVLAEPMAQLVRNARADLTDIVPSVAALHRGSGVDVTDLAVKDMMAAEIIDVASVARAAVSSAVALTSQVLRIG